MSKKRILLIGSANMDLAMNMYKLPEAGESIVDNGGVAYVPGGKGANTAVAAASFGADVVFCSRVGDDAYGDRLIELFQKRGDARIGAGFNP